MQPYFCSNCNQYHHTKQPKKSSVQTMPLLKFAELLNHPPSPHQQNFAVNSPSLPQRSRLVYADVTADCEFPQNISGQKLNEPRPLRNQYEWTNTKYKKQNQNQTTTYSTQNSKSPQKKTSSTQKKNGQKHSYGSKFENRNSLKAPPKAKESKLICEQVHCLTKETEVITKGKNKNSTIQKQSAMKSHLNQSTNYQYSSAASKNMANYATNCTHSSSFDSVSKQKQQSKVIFDNELMKKRNQNIVATMNGLKQELGKNKTNHQSKDSQSQASFSFGNDKQKKVLRVLSKIEEHCCKQRKQNRNEKKKDCSFYDNRCFGLSLCMQNQVKCIEGPHQLI